jgi:hypothetical protein
MVEALNNIASSLPFKAKWWALKGKKGLGHVSRNLEVH